MANPNEVIVKVATSKPKSRLSSISIELDRDPFHLGGLGIGSPGAGARIQWVMDHASFVAGWKLNANAITIAAPPGRFANGASEQGGKQYTYNRVIADGNTYKYSITVTNNNEKVTIDPSIINQP